ncbi:MAG: hypothetical protein IT461_04510 [Planctomycetes bacterium]|nr:hypothetical protein [Planctomycetota bacterium]
MLLIDEPETALHPSATRAAKEHLYALAKESGWQVMLSTHHPAFIDPLKDHTTIVRLHRAGKTTAPNIYRADKVKFDLAEKELLKSLLVFDLSVAEMFFAYSVLIVEGDTEFAAFSAVMDKESAHFPLESRPLILRARGKWVIPLLIRMLAQFKVNCAVLHDADSPKNSDGSKNGAYKCNIDITKEITEARKAIHVIHRCSIPDFERQHSMELPSKDKPYAAWKGVSATQQKFDSVFKALKELVSEPTEHSAADKEDGQHFESRLKDWANKYAATDPRYTF